MTTIPTNERQLNWPALIVVSGIHLAALLAFVPWLFSWTGLVLAILGCYAFGTLGINLGYHRLLTHRSFKCPLWLEHTFAILGVCCLQKTPGQFVVAHRAHHQFSDQEDDPHSPLRSFFWGHMGWVFVDNPRLDNAATYDKYGRDVLRDPFYFRLERNFFWMVLYVIHAILFFVVGFAVGALEPGGSWMAGLQFGLSLLVWGALVRTVLVWHITWSVNSLAHVWGYRNYETRENSRNNWFVGLISNGEGWHNNHHADQRAAAHGHKWWELDVSYLTLLGLRLFGLTWDLVPVSATAKSDPQDPPSQSKKSERTETATASS